MRYRAHNICPDEQTNERSERTARKHKCPRRLCRLSKA